MRTNASPRSLSAAILTILGLLLMPRALGAQTASEAVEKAGGTTYVVAFPDTTKNTFDARFPNTRYEDKCFFFIYSAVDNKISIRGNSYQRLGIPVVGGGFTVVDLMSADQKAPAPIATETCKPTRAGVFRIESESPIIVYQYMVTKFGTEAWTAIPVEAWGMEYYAAAIPGEVGVDISPGGSDTYNRKNKMFHAVISVVAAYDDTHITIIPNGIIWTKGCQLNDIVLQKDEVYQILSLVDTLTENEGTPQPDFGGSRILSTKPVGVISGNTRAQVIDEGLGLGKNSFKNMLIEWVAPVELHGTEFVSLPTWDARTPTGLPGEDLTGKRKSELVRVYGTHTGQTTGSVTEAGITTSFAAPIQQGEFLQTSHSPREPRVFRTDRPAQAFMHVPAVVKLGGLLQNGGSAYDGWGGYMVELIPREQWVDFAPFIALYHPAGIEHHINVVTDSSHRYDVYVNGDSLFPFNREVIPGTDLVWGSMTVRSGVSQFLEGRNGAKFHGFVYGGLTKGGHEEWRPFRAKGQDGDPPSFANAGGDGGILYPGEYEEYLAIAYGYPLAPSRLVVAAGDSLEIRTNQLCQTLMIDITSLNADPVGLRSVRLANAVNARIFSMDPFPIIGATSARVVITPINPNRDASATVLIKDQSGKIDSIQYRWYAERVELDPSGRLDFGTVTTGLPQTKTVTVTNPLEKDLEVRMYLVRGDQSFRILSPTTFPAVIQKDSGTIQVNIESNPPTPRLLYVDTLIIATECDSFRLPIIAEAAEPCVSVNHLSFGTLTVGESKTLSLNICNDGGGEVRFNNPAGDSVVTWLVRNFSVSPEHLELVKYSVLRRGECVRISVQFVAGISDTDGVYHDVARIWASTRNCRDTSIWTARISRTGDVESVGVDAGFSLSVSPSPLQKDAIVTFTLPAAGAVRLALYDAGGRLAAVLFEGPTGSGEHRVFLASQAMPAGVYHAELVSGGRRVSVPVVIVR
jgi:hypothetical protein